jgi:uncharacterized protein DUF1524/excalibur calcium-binding domain-containing protein
MPPSACLAVAGMFTRTAYHVTMDTIPRRRCLRAVSVAGRATRVATLAIVAGVGMWAFAVPSAFAKRALPAVSLLQVKGRAPMTGYAREQFGEGWVDVNRNGCDTRDDILRRDLHLRRVRPGTRGCVIARGVLADPYTRRLIRYARGGGSEVDVDHVVALGDAWQKGAQRWPFAKRVAFANDPLNLLAVSASANRRKGDGDAATWLPANKSFRCAYVARQVEVKRKYGLSVTVGERNAMLRVLRACPAVLLPPAGRSPVISPVGGSRPPSANRRPAKPAKTGGVRVFRNCAAVRRVYPHGVAKNFRVIRMANGLTGRPFVGPKLYAANRRSDRDDDGIACEA